VLRHAEKIGDVGKACRYFGIGRSSYYRWKASFGQNGEAGLINQKPIPKNPANQTPPANIYKFYMHGAISSRGETSDPVNHSSKGSSFPAPLKGLWRHYSLREFGRSLPRNTLGYLPKLA
jgi:hypothetical protein